MKTVKSLRVLYPSKRELMNVEALSEFLLFLI